MCILCIWARGGGGRRDQAKPGQGGSVLSSILAMVVAERAGRLRPSGPCSPKLLRGSWVLLRSLGRGDLLLSVLRLLKEESEGQMSRDGVVCRILSVARK